MEMGTLSKKAIPPDPKNNKLIKEKEQLFE
jgi:hypothetical protein